MAFNNAGTEGGYSPFEEQSNEVYDTIFNANVRGVFCFDRMVPLRREN